MSDRTAERTEPRGSEDIIAETESLLAGEKSDSERSQPAGESAADSQQGWLGQYFSPKGFLAITFVLGVGLLVGNAVVPLASIGGTVGALAVAFALGLATSKRRYLEVGLGGGTAGGLSGLLQTDLTTALMVSVSMPILIGAAVGFVASIVGYYFGRDLRDGLARDIE